STPCLAASPPSTLPHQPRLSSYDARTPRTLALTAIGHIGRSPMPNINTFVFLPPASYTNNVNKLDPTDVSEEYRIRAHQHDANRHADRYIYEHRHIHAVEYLYVYQLQTPTGTTNTPTQTRTTTTPPPSLRRPAPGSPRSSLASVRNIVALWKERRVVRQQVFVVVLGQWRRTPPSQACIPPSLPFAQSHGRLHTPCRIVPPVERPLRLPRRLTLETRPNALALRDRPRPQTRNLDVMSNSESASTETDTAYVASIARIRGGPHRMYRTHPAPPYLDATRPRRRTSTVRPTHAQRDVEDAPALVARNANGCATTTSGSKSEGGTGTRERDGPSSPRTSHVEPSGAPSIRAHAPSPGRNYSASAVLRPRCTPSHAGTAAGRARTSRMRGVWTRAARAGFVLASIGASRRTRAALPRRPSAAAAYPYTQLSDYTRTYTPTTDTRTYTTDTQTRAHTRTFTPTETDTHTYLSDTQTPLAAESWGLAELEVYARQYFNIAAPQLRLLVHGIARRHQLATTICDTWDSSSAADRSGATQEFRRPSSSGLPTKDSACSRARSTDEGCCRTPRTHEVPRIRGWLRRGCGHRARHRARDAASRASGSMGASHQLPAKLSKVSTPPSAEAAASNANTSRSCSPTRRRPAAVQAAANNRTCPSHQNGARLRRRSRGDCARMIRRAETAARGLLPNAAHSDTQTRTQSDTTRTQMTDVRREPLFVSSHHTGTVDNSVISGGEYVYPGDPRAIGGRRRGLGARRGSMGELDEGRVRELEKRNREWKWEQEQHRNEEERDALLAERQTAHRRVHQRDWDIFAYWQPRLLSYRGPGSANLLGDSHSDPSGSGAVGHVLQLQLQLVVGVRDQGLNARTTSSGYTRLTSDGYTRSSESSEDKGNSTDSESGAGPSDSNGNGSGGTGSGYTPATYSTNQTGYGVCPSSDLSDITTRTTSFLFVLDGRFVFADIFADLVLVDFYCPAP
ncbi:hypothetical protein B0H15DRAFT_992896, partial [Mycena belliarum]